ncbi:MAG: L-ribulose-5-phosphate 4-epimerase AraD [Armatimonadia bacterium]|nr:L-ribulose-5-phosphate 4-epimerase AraD [Armatimonadia bacterium]
MLEALREDVCAANLAIKEAGLVTLTWGNVSGLDPATRSMAIKPSGVSYAELTPDKIVVLAVDSGEVLWGELRPSSDTPTHLVLYRAFEGISGIVHSHSTHATAWAQARRPIPAYGTTHADHFRGAVPCTRMLTAAEMAEEYEADTGRVIAETYRRLDPHEHPSVLVAGHGPFAWGPTPAKAVENAIVLEEVARMASLTEAAAQDPRPIPRTLLDRHFLRKHGKDAYYGQR